MKRLFCALALLWSVGAMAGFSTGNELQERCLGTRAGEANADEAKYNSCVSYLTGLADVVEVLTAWNYRHVGNGFKPNGACIPLSASQEQLRQVWLKYADAKPQKLHTNAASSALNAFEEAWPCSD